MDCCVGSSRVFGRTTVPAQSLLKITNDLLMASEAKCVSVMLLLDFSKAFDSVDHDLLCAMLVDQYAVFQKCSGFYQILFKSEDAVHLGQWILFGIPTGYSGRGAGFSAWTFFSDFGQISSCNYRLCAADVQLYLSSHPSTFDSPIARLNEDLDRIHQWSMANRLFINSSKSQSMIINPSLLPIDVSPQIRLGADVIPCYKKLKNLGLLINQDHSTYMRRSDQQDMSKCFLHTKTAVAYGGLYTS
jgi:hypothetical protein